MRRMFSEKQIGEVAVEQLVNKNLKVKTLEQSEYEYTQSVELTPAISGAVVEPIYNRIAVSDGILHIILNFKVSNPTESEIGGYSLIDTSINLPSKYSEKIIDINGVSVAKSGNGFIACSHAFWGTAGIMAFGSIGAQNVWLGFNNSNIANRMKLVIVGSQRIAIGAGKTHLVSCRICLSLK